METNSDFIFWLFRKQKSFSLKKKFHNKKKREIHKIVFPCVQSHGVLCVLLENTTTTTTTNVENERESVVAPSSGLSRWILTQDEQFEQSTLEQAILCDFE